MDADPVAIKAIDAGSVHRIQSGQVIVDLCSVAKELVENSLDAGASSIDVRFKNQGLDSIEVQDNGDGISPRNYESIALKHHTSKLSTYADLASLQTFGFRGEALSSLCALAHFSIVTCMQSEVPKAKKLEFETSGKLRTTSIVAGQKGTTATVEELFYNLPVRRRELERNIKREWGKVIGLLNQYACVQTGVKFSVWQQPNKGKRVLLFSTKGNKTTRDNIINVFGAKTMSALIPLDLRLELEATRAPGQALANQDRNVHEVRVIGHVSRPIHGGGRQTPDRQMFYVNGRPCGLPQFAKVFNEVYRSYNSSQSPFIFADIQLDTGLYDVNVSPDKRTILLHDQGRMLDHLRDSLVQLFETQDYTIPKTELSARKQTPVAAGISLQSSSPVSAQRTSSRTALAGSSVRLHAAREPSDIPLAGQASRSSRDPSAISEMQTNTLQDVDQDEEESQPHLEYQPPAATFETPREAKFRLSAEADLSPKNTNDAAHADSSQAPLDETTLVDNEDASEAEDVNTELSLPDSANPGRSAMSQWLSAGRILRTEANEPSKATARKSAGGQAAAMTVALGPKRSIIRDTMSQDNNPRGRKSGFAKKPLPSFGGRLSQMFAAAARKSGDGGARERSSSPENAGSTASTTDSDVEDAESQPSELARDAEEKDEDEETEQTRGPEGEGEDEAASPPANVSSPSQFENEVDENDLDKEDDSDYMEMDEEDKKEKEDLKVQEMIKAAESAGNETTTEGEKRGQMLLKGNRRKDSTHQLVQRWEVDQRHVARQAEAWQAALTAAGDRLGAASDPTARESDDPEATLSLKISKSDFSKMRIVGQFNLGFILAVRPAAGEDEEDGHEVDTSRTNPSRREDDLFIIDQHASDEKYNFERLQATTVVQSQRLVQPRVLELTAIEEEIVMAHPRALEANGFVVRVDASGAAPVGRRVKLLNLPLSRETTFSVADLEELIVLLGDNPLSAAEGALDDDDSASDDAGEGRRAVMMAAIPRPSRTRKMFAMRACRSSIMIGRALSHAQMEKVVGHMGDMEKPWNCPHGRPTMRHLCGLGTWDESGWNEEGDAIDWAGYVNRQD